MGVSEFSSVWYGGGMKRLRLYLDTTVWNYPFAEDVPAMRKQTLEFFEMVRAGRYITHVSRAVADEIADAPPKRKSEIIHLMKGISPVHLEDHEEVDRLGDLYISRKVLPPKSRVDAQHLAFATFYEMDALISWNFRHLANISKKDKMTSVNVSEGYYRPLDLVTPLEVLSDEDA
jgi:predicted nucleic acid-binding protein